jgi:asparagine synthase (glutamine-hydrolysing)
MIFFGENTYISHLNFNLRNNPHQYLMQVFHGIYHKETTKRLGIDFSTQFKGNELVKCFDDDQFKFYYDSSVYVSIDQDVKVACFFLGRIYNIQEIKSISGVSDKELNFASIVLNLFLRKGIEASRQINGDWIYALWDIRSKKLILVRDQMGTSNLLVFNKPDRLVFSNLSSLLKSEGCVEWKLCWNQLDRFSLRYFMNQEETIIKNVLRLKSGGYYEIQGDKLVRDSYIKDLPVKSIRYKNAEQYYEHFEECFNRAVKSRLSYSNKPGSLLSSGLDSSSVSYVAAKLLNNENKSLEIYSYKPIYDSSSVLSVKRAEIWDETGLSSLISSTFDNITLNLVDSKDYSPIEGILFSHEVHPIIPIASGNQYWLLSILQNARNSHVDTLLHAQYGNNTISWTFPGMRYSPSVGSNSMLKAKRYIKSTIPESFLKSQRIKRLIEREEVLSCLKRNVVLRICNENFYAIEEARRGVRRINSKPGNLGYCFNISGNIVYEQSSYFNLFLSDPTADINVINFCASIPEEVYYNKTGNRLLVKKTFNSLIPNSVLNLNSHGIQAADIGHRMIAEIEKINDILYRLERNPAVTEYIDLNKIKMALGNITEHYDSEAYIWANIIAHGISLGLFIDQF